MAVQPPAVNLRNAVSAPASEWADYDGVEVDEDELPPTDIRKRWLNDGETLTEIDTGNTKTGPGFWHVLPYNEASGGSGTSGSPSAGFSATLGGVLHHAAFPVALSSIDPASPLLDIGGSMCNPRSNPTQGALFTGLSVVVSPFTALGQIDVFVEVDIKSEDQANKWALALNSGHQIGQIMPGAFAGDTFTIPDLTTVGGVLTGTDLIVAADGITSFTADAWQAETAYSDGDRVQPTTPNGHTYTANGVVTSGTDEPAWHTDATQTPDGSGDWDDAKRPSYSIDVCVFLGND